MAKVMPVPLEQGRAACADHLPLVDAAYIKPGGPEAQELKQLCLNCPVIETCFTWAMTHGETGIWGGIGPKLRTQHGAPRPKIRAA